MNRARARVRSAVALAVTVAFAGAACGDGENPAGPPGGSQVVVGSWGGDYQNFLKQFVEPALSDADNAPSVVYDTADQTARMTKMRTESDGDGTIDATMLGDTDMQQMIDADLLDKIDPSRIPNFEHVQQNLTNDFWVPHIFSANVIIYNTDKVTPAPDSYGAVWDPKYQGKIGVLSTQWFNFYYAAAALLKGGDPGNEVDDGWEKLKELSDSVQVFGSQEQLGQAMISGQVWMTVNWKARAYQWNKAGGEPISSVIPKEGTFPVIFAAGVPKNAPDKDAAYAYINAMLDPDAQAKFAENMGYAPTVDNAELAGELRSELDVPSDQRDLVRPLDYAYTAANDARWRQQWEQEFVN